MHVEVRCYGEVREVVGTESLELTFDGATVADALGALAESHPSFDGDALSGGLVVMRNGSHADEATRLEDGDVLNLSETPFRE